MVGRDFGFKFDGQTIYSLVLEHTTDPPPVLDEEFLVFVMGPYTAFDATYAFDDAEELESPYVSDPLFDPESHIGDDGRASYESALADYCSDLREAYGVRAFLATDVGIPTATQAGPREPSKSVLDQSVAFAAVSDAVVFVFSHAGLTTGVGSEFGAILGEFHLRSGNREPVRKPRERFRVFRTSDSTSASIGETPDTYEVDVLEFETRGELLTKSQQFLVNLERDDPDRNLRVFNPPG